MRSLSAGYRRVQASALCSDNTDHRAMHAFGLQLSALAPLLCTTTHETKLSSNQLNAAPLLHAGARNFHVAAEYR